MYLTGGEEILDSTKVTIHQNTDVLEIFNYNFYG